MKIKDLAEAGVGKITKQNTTVDVKPGETERQAKKFFGGTGKPLPLHAKAAQNSTPNKLYNLGLAENMSVTGTERRRLEKKKGIEIGSPEWFKHWFDLPYLREDKSESYLLQLERDYDNDMLVLHVLDNRKKHRTEVRGKMGYESGNYDPEDKLHKILDDIGKAANMSELMNGEVVSINPNHPDGERAKAVARQLTREDISRVDLEQLEKFADKLFGKVGIDVEFTRHFLDRVNDVRNKKPITMSELTRLFKQEYKRWGKPIAQMGPDQEAVMKDLQTDINLPFALRWDSKNNELDLIAKTVMRKADFKTPNQEFPVEDMAVENIPSTNKPGTIGQMINWGGKNAPPVKKTNVSVARRKQPDPQSWWQQMLAKGKDLFDDEQIEEESPWSVLTRKAGHVLKAEQYKKAAKFLHNILQRKYDETDGKLRHSLGYYAQMLSRQTGNRIDWRELQAEYLDTYGNAMFEKITKDTPMGDVIDDFYKSDAPQFKGKSKEKRRQMAIAAKLSMMDSVDENFADGKKKGKSRPGRVKRAGASCDGSVSELRKKAKNSSGEKQKMYHWCANMKSGRSKNK